MRVFSKHWPQILKASDEALYDPYLSIHKITGEKLTGPVPLIHFLNKDVVQELNITSQMMPRHSRPKFHQILLDQVHSLGLQVEYDCEVAEYFEDAQAGRGGAITTGGQRIEADLVVAADGVRGQSWKLVGDGKMVPAKSSGDAMYRVIFPRDRLRDDSELMSRFGQEVDGHSVMEMWYG